MKTVPDLALFFLLFVPELKSSGTNQSISRTARAKLAVKIENISVLYKRKLTAMYQSP